MLTVHSTYNASVPLQRLRVKAGKAGKVRTELAVLRRWEPETFANGYVSTRNLFEQFNKVFDPVNGWQPTATLAKVTEKEKLVKVLYTGKANTFQELCYQLLIFKGVNVQRLKEEMAEMASKRTLALESIRYHLGNYPDPETKEKLKALKKRWASMQLYCKIPVNCVVIGEGVERKEMDNVVIRDFKDDRIIFWEY